MYIKYSNIILFGIILNIIILAFTSLCEQFKDISVGIVTTVKKPHKFDDWIKYHLKIGFTKLYVVLDDENEDISYPSDKVVFIKNNKNWKKELSELNMGMFYDQYDKEVMSRQVLNYANVKKIAIKDNIDWLLHIDADELFYPESGSLSSIFDNKYDVIRFENLEMLPMNDNYENCFVEGIHFKTNKYIYVAYTNGKSALKVTSNSVINGVHGFSGGISHDSDSGKILHYPSCNFEEYINKYKILGKFNNKWWDQIDIPIVFHTESRDIIQSCSDKDFDDECIQKVRNYYNVKNVNNDSIKPTDYKIIEYVNNILK